MCPVRGRYRHSGQRCQSPHRMFESDIRMHQKSWTQANNAQMPFWGNGKWYPWKNNYPRGRQAVKGKNNNFPGTNQIPKIWKGPKEIPWIPELLQELHPKSVWEISPIRLTSQKGREDPSDHGASTTIQWSQQGPWQVQSIGFKASIAEQTTSPNDRC